MYDASVENDAAGSHVVTLPVAATFKIRGAGVGGTAVGGTAVGLAVGGTVVGGADVGGAATGAVVAGAGVAAGPHAAISMTTMVSADNNLKCFISSSLPLPQVC
jgi:hypothetical protein